MSKLIDSIIKTREIAAGIFADCLVDIDGFSEAEIVQKILSEVKKHEEIFPEGWYSPPAGGAAVLLDQVPFERLAFETLRKPESWPNETLKFEKESAAMIYFSPVDRKTNMIGDIGFTYYTGDDQEIRAHIKKSYSAILEIAKHAEVGMSFSELYKFGIDFLTTEFKVIGWVTINLAARPFINFGHTVPGSYENDFKTSSKFEEVREFIRTKRYFINEIEEFEIKETCAMTIETRLFDKNNPNLPCVYFHFIVCFDQGKKTVLENFNEIFKAVGMNYMYE